MVSVRSKIYDLLYSLIKKPGLPEKKRDCLNDNFDKLLELTMRMDRLDTMRRKQERFVDVVVQTVNPELLKRDGYGNYTFLNDEKAAQVLRASISKILKEN